MAGSYIHFPVLFVRAETDLLTSSEAFQVQIKRWLRGIYKLNGSSNLRARQALFREKMTKGYYS
jgi:hypothetical protein